MMTETRSPWTDRFTTPAPKDLRAGLTSAHAGLFDRLVKGLEAIEGLEETPLWYAEPWFWTLAWQTPLDAERPLAVIVPRPEDLQVAMPMDAALADRLAGGKIRKSIAEGIDMVREPYDSTWAVWSLTTTGEVDDVLGLCRKKLEYLQERASGG